MANYIESQNSINSLKASFCRQHFQDLLQFLRDFDISQTKGKAAKNSLRMDFLLQAYDHSDKITKGKKDAKGKKDTEKADEFNNSVEQAKQEAIQLKSACKWHLGDIDEEKLFLAVDEYFEIIQMRRDTNEASNTLLRNINTRLKAKELFPIVDNAKESVIYKFEDYTTISILNYFGIEINDSKLGIQRAKFANFILDSSGKLFRREGNKNEYINGSDQIFPQSLYDSVPEAQFIEAFRLLVNVRNWSEHNHSFLQKSDYALLLYKFIIFTHIGVVFICRRLWDNENSRKNLIKKKYNYPGTFDKPNVVDLKIKIEGNKVSDKISDCTWSVGDIKDERISDFPQREIVFAKKVKRYQEFTIKYKYNGKPQDPITGLIDYYPWNPVLDILVKPPHEISGTLECIAGEDEEAEEYLSNIFTKCINRYFGSYKNSCDEALKKLGELEPSIMELQGLLGKVDKDSEDRKKIIHDTIIPQLKGIDQDLNDIKTSVNKTYELLKNNSRVLGLLFLGVAGGFFIYSIINKLFTLLQFPTILSLISSLAILLFGIALYYIIKQQSTFKFLQGKTPKAKLSFYLISTILFAAIVGFLGYGIKIGRDIYLNGYDFADNDTGKNQKAVKLMNFILKTNPEDDQDLRIQLASYYLKYTGEIDKALQVCAPMFKDIKKYSKGIWAYAEILYEKKDYHGVWTILNYVKEDSPTAEYLEGVLLARGEGCTKNVHKGLEKLIKAYNKGSKDAGYQLGRFLVNDMTDWNVPGKTINLSDLDIIRGVYYLRECANSRPQAAIELGKLYADLNMIDSAQFYYAKAIKVAKDTLLMEAKYRMGLLKDTIKTVKHYMLEAELAKYPPALIHQAIKDSDHIRLIDTYKAAGTYNGYRYIPPIVFEYIAINQLDNAFQFLRMSHPNGMFDENFVNGMVKILGSDYVSQDTLAGTELIKKSAGNGCKFAQMIVLFTQLQQMIDEGKTIMDSQLEELEAFAKRDSINFAYVLEANLLNRNNCYDKAYCAAMKATSLGHPAGVLELRDHSLKNSSWTKYLESVKANISKCYWFYRTKQIALRRAPNSAKQRAISSGYEFDNFIFGINGESYPEYRLVFWSDVVIANHRSDMSFLLLDLWMTGVKNSQSDFYKRRLLVSAIENHEGAYGESERNLIVAVLNNLADSSFRDSLIKKYGKNQDVKELLSSIDDRGFKPMSNYKITDGIFSLQRIPINGIINELSDHIGIDYFKDPFAEN